MLNAVDAHVHLRRTRLNLTINITLIRFNRRSKQRFQTTSPHQLGTRLSEIPSINFSEHVDTPRTLAHASSMVVNGSMSVRVDFLCESIKLNARLFCSSFPVRIILQESVMYRVVHFLLSSRSIKISPSQFFKHVLGNCQ